MHRIYDSDGSVFDLLCGKYENYKFTSIGSKLTLVFHSDVDIEDLGFAARWKRVKGPRQVCTVKYNNFLINPFQGIATSPGYPGKYPTCFLDRVAVIEAPKNSNIFLRVYKLDSERFYDYLFVAKGVLSKDDLPSKSSQVKSSQVVNNVK